MTFTPDGRMLIAERDGTVWVVQPGATQRRPHAASSSSRASPTDNERGLLGITVDPAFAPNGYVYVYYTHSSLRNRVSRFTRQRQQRAASSEFVVWQNNVDADDLAPGRRPALRARRLPLHLGRRPPADARPRQQLTSYNGKILRVTRDGAVPADNPFHDGAGPNLDAIWVRGLRNPFRFSIDPPTGRMIIGDVGEGTIEEVNVGVARRQLRLAAVRGRVRHGRHDQPGLLVPARRPRRVDHRRLRLPRHPVPGASTAATTSSPTTP